MKQGIASIYVQELAPKVWDIWQARFTPNTAIGSSPFSAVIAAVRQGNS
jgi:hypothetical protein